MRLHRSFLILIMTLTLAGCGGGGGQAGPQAVSTASVTTAATPAISFDGALSVAPVGAAKTFTFADGSAVEAASSDLLITVGDDATTAQIDVLEAALGEMGGVVVGTLPESRMVQVRFPPSVDLLVARTALEGLAGIEGVALDEAQERDEAVSIPSASFSGDWWIAMINAPAAWGLLAKGQSGPTVGVVDGGTDDLARVMSSTRLQLFDGKGGTLPLTRPTTGDGHLTNVVGFASASPVDTPLAWGVSLQSKVVAYNLGDADLFTSNINACAERAVGKGARVVNLSLGPTTKCEDAEPTRLRAAEADREGSLPLAALARKKDILVCLSSGNECQKNDNRWFTPDSKAKPYDFQRNVLIVSGTTATRQIASFAVEGTIVDIAAPAEGVSVGVTVEGRSTTSGTSFACPIVAGAAALCMQLGPDLMAIEVRQILLDTASTNLTSTGNRLKLLDIGAAATGAKNLGGVARSTALDVSVAVGATTTRTVTVTPPTGATQVALQVVGDSAGWLTPPTVATVDNDGKATFTLTFKGQSWAAYDVMLWASTPKGAVFARIPVSVRK